VTLILSFISVYHNIKHSDSDFDQSGLGRTFIH